MTRSGDDRLTNADRAALIGLRRALHAAPELSGAEHATAARIAAALSDLRPDRIITGLGGTGVAAVWAGAAPGPTLLFRGELDAIAVHEASGRAYRSTQDGVAHLCGHDGHMTILIAVARMLARRPPASGRVVLMFQPAEETGAGAAAVLDDPRFAGIVPNFAFALHNMPGLPLGEVRLPDGPANCASCGIAVTLTGTEAHASEPEKGLSPAAALADLIPVLTGLSDGEESRPGFRLVTVTHMRLGEPAFGIAPGRAELWATLRALTDAETEALAETAEARVAGCAARHALGCTIDRREAFAHCENDTRATAILRRAMTRIGVPHSPDFPPMRASEDFGRFGRVAPAAMAFLGSGLDCPPLHSPEFDFPDELIGTGAAIFTAVIRDLLG